MTRGRRSLIAAAARGSELAVFWLGTVQLLLVLSDDFGVFKLTQSAGVVAIWLYLEKANQTNAIWSDRPARTSNPGEHSFDGAMNG